MKKIELRVDGLGAVEGSIPKEVANRVMVMVLDGLRAVVPEEDIIAELVSPIMNVCEEVITEVEEEEKEVVSEGRELRRLDYNPFAYNSYFESSRLVVHKCDDCGKITIRRMYLMETNITSCHWCKKEARVHTVARVDVQCASCGSSYYVWTANSLDEIECKDCQAPNDLTYYDSGRKGCTPNLRY